MLYLDINGRQLLLPANTTAQVEHVNPLFADGVEDSFSLPVEVPAEGNEEVLGNVHVLPLAERPQEYHGAHLGHDGQPLFPGKLHVLSTTEQRVRMTFLVNGWVSRMKEHRLPEVLAGEVIDLTDELINQNISLHIRPSYRQGGKCQFPMFLAPELYGDTNPDWKDRAQDYDADREYAVNDQIRYTTYDVVERTEIWRCSVATNAGETPETHPAKWDKAQYGVANAWDRASNQHHYNTVEGNFYTFVPWFYVKWVLRRLFNFYGYELRGEFMDDTRYDEWTLPNLTTIDAAAPATSVYFLRATSTGPVYNTLGAGNRMYVQAQDETTGLNQDPDDVWDPTTGEYIVRAAGTFALEFTVRMNRHVAASGQYSGFTEYVAARLYDENDVLVQSVELPGVLPWDLTRKVTFIQAFTLGDVGRRYRCEFVQEGKAYLNFMGWGLNWYYVPLWPTAPTDGYLSAQVRSWQNNANPGVNRPADTITASRHMPDVPVLDFVNAWIDALCLKHDTDEGARVVYLNYRQNTLAREAENASERMVGTTEIDLQRRIKGYRFAWDIDQHKESPESLLNAAQYFTEDDLPQPTNRGQLAVTLSTRMLYRTTFNTSLGVFYWKAVGHHVPERQEGEQEGAVEVVPALKPLHMRRITKDLRTYLVPVIEGTGTSEWSLINSPQTDIYVCEFKKQRSKEDLGPHVIPGARSWGYGWDAVDRSASTLEWDQRNLHFNGLFQAHWQAWVQAMLSAEPVTMDLLVDGPWLRGRQWQNMLHIHGQNYLCERIPTEYGRLNGPLVSSGAYLYRVRSIRPLRPSPETPSFLCSGPGYGSFTVLSGALLTLMSSTGYVTLRQSSDGTLLTVTDGNDLPLTNAGGYCLWNSDDTGALTGGILFIYDAPGPMLRTVDVRGYDQLTALLLDSSLEEVLLPQDSALFQLYLIGTENSFEHLDLSQQTVLDEFGLTFVGTHLDFSACAGLRVLTVVSATLATVVAPPNATLHSVVINDAALDQASVDALLLACDETHTGGMFVVEGGTSAGPSTSPEVNAKLAALSLNLWTILVN